MNCSEDGLTCLLDNETNPQEAWCGCLTDAQCASIYDGAYPYCNLTLNACAECNKDEQCGQNELCDEYGECVPGSSASSITCAGVSNYYNCQTDAQGHSWLVLCQNGEIIDVDTSDSDVKTMDCTAAGSTCIDGWFDSKMCGCTTNDDCASGVCLASGSCEEAAPTTPSIDDLPSDLCAGRGDNGFCYEFNGTTFAIFCYQNELDDWTEACVDGEVCDEISYDNDGVTMTYAECN